jgi:hypothetical protein
MQARCSQARPGYAARKLRRMTVDGACAILGVLAGTLAMHAARGGAQDASTGIYVRNDTDFTTVITPRVRVGGNLSEAARLDVSYSVDVWTSASVDIRTSASKPARIDPARPNAVQPVTEQRDEINVSLAQDFAADLKLTGGYRFSSEPDYESHGATLGVSRDFADRSATLALVVAAFFDDVGRVGFPSFSRSTRTYNARLSFTQVLDPQSFVQGIYEANRSDGYLSSPYRFVGIGSLDGSCAGAIQLRSCIPETNPAERMRHAFAVRARRALSDRLSLGAGYRFYIDDWDLMSHTAEADMGWVPDESTLISLRYRFYLQTAASHYRATFNGLRVGPQFYTRDKELSPFTGHRLGIDIDRSFALDDAGTLLRASASLGWNEYFYSNFRPLSRITAQEITLSMGLQL